MNRVTCIDYFVIDDYYIHRRDDHDILFIVKDVFETTQEDTVVRGISIHKYEGIKISITILKKLIIEYEFFHITKEDNPEYFL